MGKVVLRVGFIGSYRLKHIYIDFRIYNKILAGPCTDLSRITIGGPRRYKCSKLFDRTNEQHNCGKAC